jgi:hypothetical protein
MLSKASALTLRVQFNLGKARSYDPALPWQVASRTVVAAQLPANRAKHLNLNGRGMPDEHSR